MCFLGQKADFQAVKYTPDPVVRGDVSMEQFEQAAFTAAVSAQNADPLAPIYYQAGVIEQQGTTEAEIYVLEFYEHDETGKVVVGRKGGRVREPIGGCVGFAKVTLGPIASADSTSIMNSGNTHEMTRRLVSFETVSRDSNLPLIEFIENCLDDYGVESFRVSNDDGSKANLVATIGPDEPGGVILSGHTDVVPVDGQAWSGNPFDPWVAHGRLYGRGTCDMKAFIAAILAALPRMKSLKRPLHLALSYDEEVGCLGAPRMIERIAEALPQCRAIIVGEPTSMQSVCAHKGIVALRTRVTGFEAHSSQTHRGVSAVMVAARLVTFLDDVARRLAQESKIDTGFEPPYTTVHVGVIRGGTAINIVSRDCEFIWDIRALPGEDVQTLIDEFEGFCRDQILPDMRTRHQGASIVTEITANAPGFEVTPDSPAVELVQYLTGISAIRKVSYAAEAGQFQALKIPTVICGPGSIDQAHKPDEFIELEQLDAIDALMHRLIDQQNLTSVGD
jgi:acetylornithine deacetylase